MLDKHGLHFATSTLLFFQRLPFFFASTLPYFQTQRRVTSPTSLAKHQVTPLSPTSTLPELLRRGHDIYFRDDRMTKLKTYQALDLMKLKQQELESRYDPSIPKGHILAYYMG